MGLLSDFLFPRRCASCRAPAASWLCDSCFRAVPWIESSCARCGLPSRPATPECVPCRSLRPDFGAARAVAVYAGPARDALIAFKLCGERRAARDLAREMARVAADLPSCDVVTFVPATARARAARGFVPAEDLARHVARGLGRSCRRLLRKTRETADQAGLSRTDRLQNVRGVFVSAPCEGSVLLVDDILTTGATAHECARALRRAGARDVAVLTFARAL